MEHMMYKKKFAEHWCTKSYSAYDSIWSICKITDA